MVFAVSSRLDACLGELFSDCLFSIQCLIHIPKMVCFLCLLGHRSELFDTALTITVFSILPKTVSLVVDFHIPVSKYMLFIGHFTSGAAVIPTTPEIRILKAAGLLCMQV